MFERFQRDFPNLIIIPVNSEEEAFKFVEQKSRFDSSFNDSFSYMIKKKVFFDLKILNQPKNYENNLKIGLEMMNLY